MWWNWRESTRSHVASFRVVLESAGMIADELAEEMAGERQTIYGVLAYDRRPSVQRLRLLTEVVAAFVERRRCPPLSGVERTSTVEVLCRHTATMVRQEIDAQIRRELFPGVDPFSWRAVVWPCVSARRTGLVSDESIDLRGWNFALEELCNQVQTCFDEQASAARDLLLQPVVSNVDIEELWRRLRTLTHEPTEWSTSP